MSPREKLANDVLKFIEEHGLDFWGSEVEISSDGRYRSAAFGKAAVVDGVVRVYSPRFINVQYRTSYRYLPERDSRVFTDVNDALSFLFHAFVDMDFEAALSVPTKK